MCSLQPNKAFAGNAIKSQRTVPAPCFYTERALVSGSLAHPTYYELDFLHLQAVLPGTALGLQLPYSHTHALRQVDTLAQDRRPPKSQINKPKAEGNRMLRDVCGSQPWGTAMGWTLGKHRCCWRKRRDFFLKAGGFPIAWTRTEWCCCSWDYFSSELPP